MVTDIASLNPRTAKNALGALGIAHDDGQMVEMLHHFGPPGVGASCLSMVFSENRCTPRIKSGAGFFGIML
jgi:hypothetical protein